MKMAKPSQDDIDAAGDLMSLLNDIDREYYPVRGDQENAPTFFDEDDPEHLRHFYKLVKATLDKAPGYQGRVIGGMCYVIMWDKNEIVDPDSDTIDLHPKLVKALECVEKVEAGAQDQVARDKELADAMTVFDMGLGFALCHRDFSATRDAVKKLQEDFKEIRALALRQPSGTDGGGA